VRALGQRAKGRRKGRASPGPHKGERRAHTRPQPPRQQYPTDRIHRQRSRPDRGHTAFGALRQAAGTGSASGDCTGARFEIAKLQPSELSEGSLRCCARPTAPIVLTRGLG
jgi:hypothetical protein